MRQADFLLLASDQRFSKVLEALRTPAERGKAPEIWIAKDGRKVARVQRGSERFVVAFDEKVAPAFGDFVLRELDSLLAAYERSLEAPRGSAGGKDC
jgi:ParB family chromosome partitioning protein